MLSVRLRATVYTLVIPGFLVGYLPWKLRDFEETTSSPGSFLSWIFYPTGALLCVLGVALIVSAAAYLLRRGDGTPFPLDPPRRMVVAGPYAHIQHPMLVGCLTVLCGQAFWFESGHILTYAVLLAVAGIGYVRYVEEPELRNRFGEDYAAYQTAIPRWFPSREPRRPPDSA